MPCDSAASSRLHPPPPPQCVLRLGQLSVVFGVHSTSQTPRGYGWVPHLGAISPPQSFASAGEGQLGAMLLWDLGAGWRGRAEGACGWL